MLPSFLDLRVAILGAGITGQAVAKVLNQHGAHVELVDENLNIEADFLVLDPHSIDISNYDAVVISPGWRENHPVIISAIAHGLQILNEIDIAWNISQEISPQQKWLAITGTNGKTTTVEMATAILQQAGIKAAACGNVGDTVIEAVTAAEPFEYLILELSSFQLHWSKLAHFSAVALLNIADDHLDWHGSFEAYARAKFSILDRAEMAILNADDGEIIKRSQAWQGRRVFFTLDTPQAGEIGVVENLIVDRAFVEDANEAAMIAAIEDIQPTLPHSVSNAMAAAALARSVGVSYEDIRKALSNFHTSHHRMELIHERDGVSWINDSKATNPHAAQASLRSYLSVIWIAGGLAKGADMNTLVERTRDRIKAAILVGTDRDLIEEAFVKFSPLTPRIMIDAPKDYTKGGESNSLMESIVSVAKDLVVSGDTVLLAPACASMDQFISYADRGERFAKAVTKIVDHEK